MPSCAEQGQIQKYKTHAYKTLKPAGVQTIMLKHPTKQLKRPIKPKIPCQRTHKQHQPYKLMITHTHTHTHTRARARARARYTIQCTSARPIFHTMPLRRSPKRCLFVGCLTSQQHASVSQRRICSNKFTCCRTEIEVADHTFHLTQSQYTDTGPTSPVTLYRQAPGREATGVPILKSLV